MEDSSTPRAGAQKASSIASSSSTSLEAEIGFFASPRPHNPLRTLRTPYLPTPSPSPLSSASASAMSTINIVPTDSCYNKILFDTHDAHFSRMRDLPLKSGLCMTPPHTPLSQKTDQHPSPPPPYDMGSMDNNWDWDADAVTKILGDLGIESEVDVAYPSTASKFTSGRIMYEAFRKTRSRVIRVSHLPYDAICLTHECIRPSFFNLYLNHNGMAVYCNTRDFTMLCWWRMIFLICLFDGFLHRWNGINICSCLFRPIIHLHNINTWLTCIYDALNNEPTLGMYNMGGHNLI